MQLTKELGYGCDNTLRELITFIRILGTPFNFGISILVTFIILYNLRRFIIYSAVATVSFSVSYSIFEQFEPLWPQLANAPLLASIIGAVFVGIGAGLCVKVGGAVSGDDALAMCVSHVFHMRVEWAYLVSDITVLALSLSYIPISRIGYSLLTVILSGQIIGLIQRINFGQNTQS